MPVQVTYPGVYIEELSAGVRSIDAVDTSIAAFVDVFARGPVDQPVLVRDIADFERQFGGLDHRSESSYGVSQFFRNGGRSAMIVRVVPAGATAASASVGGLQVVANSPGAWGNSIDASVIVLPDATLSVVVRLTDARATTRTETFHGLLTDGGPSDVRLVVGQQSTLVRIDSVAVDVNTSLRNTPLSGGDDGFDAPSDGSERDAAIAVVAAALSQPDDGTGMYTLRNAESFNLLCLPATAFMSPGDRLAVSARAAAFCEEQRAFFVADPPADATPVDFAASQGAEIEHLSANAAVWCPALTIPDSLDANRMRTVASSGTMAGVIARVDTNRGVWKAPAGLAAQIRGAMPKFAIGQIENQALAEQGLNAIRTFATRGALSWGARTLHGADAAASEWKYVPVRRLALFIEESLEQGLHWTVFEPNDEMLWAQIRASVDAFLLRLFRQGALMGSSPEHAYFVLCDRTTTSQTDIDRGIVNLAVGFAPLKPAEFVIINIQMRAAV